MATPRSPASFTEWTNNPWRIRTLSNQPFQIDPNTQFVLLWGTPVIGRGQPNERVPCIERPPFVHVAPRGTPLLKATAGGAGVDDVDIAVGNGKNWIISHWAMWADEAAAVAASVKVSDGVDFIPIWTGTLAATAITVDTAQVGTFNPIMKLLSGGFVRFTAAMSGAHVLGVRLWMYEVDEE